MALPRKYGKVLTGEARTQADIELTQAAKRGNFPINKDAAKIKAEQIKQGAESLNAEQKAMQAIIDAKFNFKRDPTNLKQTEADSLQADKKAKALEKIFNLKLGK